MPRPAIQRRKQNSFSKPSPKRPRGPPDASAHREYLQKKLANVKVGSKPENSDDSDGIVTSRAGRSRRTIEIYASGAVAKGDKPGAFPTRSQRTRSLRDDTDEILSQRSRSTSRAASVTSTRSVQAHSAPPKESTGAKNITSTKRQKITQPDANTNGAPSNAQTETSVLGVIKPRKRQNSILETMGIGYDGLGPDSSAIHSDEEERFLPDEVSTPAQVSKNGAPSDTARTTSSRKRKRDEAVAIQQAPASVSLPLSSLVSQRQSSVDVPEIPRPSRSQQRKLSTTQRASKAFNDIMAPPESSDSEDSSDEAEPLPVQSPKLRKQNPVVPSTRQLQNLMPTKREKPISAFQPRDEFDIREDSTSTSEEEEQQEEHSTFSPVRTRRGQRNGTTQPKGKTKEKEKTKKPMAKGGKENGKTKAVIKSTRNTSYTPSPVHLRTPIPLSSSKPRGSEAKSPSKQDTIMRDKSANTSLATRVTRSTKKRYGGSQRKEAGKENQPISLSDVASGSDSGSVDKEKLKVARRQANGPEIKAWKKKWANIDDFELEFEEVPVSTRSSSPTGMSR